MLHWSSFQCIDYLQIQLRTKVYKVFSSIRSGDNRTRLQLYMVGGMQLHTELLNPIMGPITYQGVYLSSSSTSTLGR